MWQTCLYDCNTITHTASYRNWNFTSWKQRSEADVFNPFPAATTIAKHSAILGPIVTIGEIQENNLSPWLLLNAYSEEKLESSNNKASSCFLTRTLPKALFKPTLRSLTAFMDMSNPVRIWRNTSLELINLCTWNSGVKWHINNQSHLMNPVSCKVIRVRILYCYNFCSNCCTNNTTAVKLQNWNISLATNHATLTSGSIIQNITSSR